MQKSRGRRPFPFGFIATCARQLLHGLELLCTEHLVHADIKPQNVVLRQPRQGFGELDTIMLDEWTLVTLIDFGSCLSFATLDRCSSTGAISYVQSRWCRPVALFAAAWIERTARTAIALPANTSSPCYQVPCTRSASRCAVRFSTRHLVTRLRRCGARAGLPSVARRV